MKKFGSGDIIYNKIKTYPKVRFFANSGSISYNNNTDTSGNAVLFDFLRTPVPTTIPEDCFLLAEDGQILLTENNIQLQPEYCETIPSDCSILTETGQILFSELSQQMITEECL